MQRFNLLTMVFSLYSLPAGHVDVEDHELLCGLLHVLIIRHCDGKRSLLRIVYISTRGSHTRAVRLVLTRHSLHGSALGGLQPVHLSSGERDDGEGEGVATRLDEVHHLLVCGALHVHVVHLEDPVSPKHARHLRGAARQHSRDVLQRRVQLAIDRLEVPTLAHLHTTLK